MSSFPTEQDMIDIHAKVADLVGCSPELADPDMLRAVILGVRLSRRGGEVHRGPFERAAALVELVGERMRTIPGFLDHAGFFFALPILMPMRTATPMARANRVLSSRCSTDLLAGVDVQQPA